MTCYRKGPLQLLEIRFIPRNSNSNSPSETSRRFHGLSDKASAGEWGVCAGWPWSEKTSYQGSGAAPSSSILWYMYYLMPRSWIRPLQWRLLQTKTPPKFKLQSHPKLTTNNLPLHTETTHTRSHYPIPHLIPPSLSGNCLHRSSQSHDLADDLLAPLPVPEHPLTLHLLLQCAGSVFLSGGSAPTRPPPSPSKPAPPVHTNHHLGTSPLPATDRRAVALPRNNSRLTRRTWSVVSTAP